MTSDDKQAESPARVDDWIAQWIAQARAGSFDALAKLMEFSRKYLLLIANDELPAVLQAKAGASDLVQETQMEAVEGFGQFNNLHDLGRRFQGATKRQTSREVSLAESGGSQNLAEKLVGTTASPSSHLSQSEQEDRVEAAIAKLPEDYRQVILWRHRENCSFEEISERMNRSLGAVRKLWARAVRALQEQLKSAHE